MKEFTISFNLNDPPIQMFRQSYEFFLKLEHTTHQKDLWLEQKRIYEEILNAENPEKALEEFHKRNITTAELARQRLGKKMEEKG